jgi:nesprin-1
VNDHYQYTKAVMETTEWLTATTNTVEMWGDNTLERLSLHANLERLKNLQVSFPQEESKIEQLKECAEKVLPGTNEFVQSNVKSQVESSTQEWKSLHATVQLTIENLESKIKQWQEYENIRDNCLTWRRESNTKLNNYP